MVIPLCGPQLKRKGQVEHMAGKQKDCRHSLLNPTGKNFSWKRRNLSGRENPWEDLDAKWCWRAAGGGRGEGQQGVAGVRVGRVAVLLQLLFFSATRNWLPFTVTHTETASSKNTQRSILKSSRLDLVMWHRQKQIKGSSEARDGETILMIRFLFHVFKPVKTCWAQNFSTRHSWHTK